MNQRDIDYWESRCREYAMDYLSAESQAFEHYESLKKIWAAIDDVCLDRAEIDHVILLAETSGTGGLEVAISETQELLRRKLLNVCSRAN